jgi:hypothetical protein
MCALLILPFCWACSGAGLNTVEGKVNVNGAPAKGAVVIFHPKGGDTSANAQRPSGVTKEDGTFTLGTGTKPGAPVGEYTVTITWPEEVGPPKFKKGSMELDNPTPADRLKGRFANAASSTLKATIKSGANKLDPFELN